MTIERICTRDVVCLSADATVEEAVILMEKRRVGCIVVVDNVQLMPMPVGIITDRDILMRASLKKLPFDKTKLATVMTADAMTLPGDTSTYKALGLMRANGVRRVPLVSKQGELIGIVTLDDLLNFLADEFTQLADLIRKSTKRAGYQQ